jgi:RND family efflux transporter MFP subunit
MKRLILILLALALAAGVAWRLHSVLSKAPEGRRRGGSRAVAVALEPVRRQTVRDVGEFTGTLQAESRFVIAPKVPGRLEKLMVNIGDTVARGDLVAVVESEEYEQQVAQARAELEVSRANLAESRSALNVSKREFDRARELREQKVASEAELDEAEARYSAAQAKHEVAEAQIRQKEAALKTAEVRLGYTRIHAAWEDADERRVIAERFVDEGALLKVNDPIVSVVDLSRVIAVVHVIERDFPDIRLGQSVTIRTDAYGDRRFSGTIVRRAPILREESRQARVEIEIPNPDRLLAPGMFVRAEIEFAEHKDATVVPVAALVRRNSDRGVFLADMTEKKVRFVPTEVGVIDGAVAEVLKPAELDGLVVALGHHLLEDGGAIIVPEAGEGAETPRPGPGRREGARP